MNRATAAAAILATLTFGCATTKVGAPATSASIDAVQRDNPGTTFVVELLPPEAGVPEPHTGRLTLVGTTPTKAIVAERRNGASTQLTMPSSDVASLSVTRHGRGALYGAGVGVLLAGALTGLAALTLGPCSGCENDFTRGDAARIVGLYLGIPAFVLSTGVGALIGARTTYVFE